LFLTPLLFITVFLMVVRCRDWPGNIKSLTGILLAETTSVLRLYLIVLLATLAVSVLPALDAFAGQMSAPKKSAPQGQDPPGADIGQPQSPPPEGEVIAPPPVGDEEIYTEAPNPEAGHEEEVIPPPAPTQRQD
jgi:hypothetical protein